MGCQAQDRPETLNQPGYLSFHIRRKARAVGGTPLRKQHVIPAECRSGQKILESKGKDSEWQGTWGYLGANMATRRWWPNTISLFTVRPLSPNEELSGWQHAGST